MLFRRTLTLFLVVLTAIPQPSGATNLGSTPGFAKAPFSGIFNRQAIVARLFSSRSGGKPAQVTLHVIRDVPGRHSHPLSNLSQAGLTPELEPAVRDLWRALGTPREQEEARVLEFDVDTLSARWFRLLTPKGAGDLRDPVHRQIIVRKEWTLQLLDSFFRSPKDRAAERLSPQLGFVRELRYGSPLPGQIAMALLADGLFAAFLQLAPYLMREDDARREAGQRRLWKEGQRVSELGANVEALYRIAAAAFVPSSPEDIVASVRRSADFGRMIRQASYFMTDSYVPLFDAIVRRKDFLSRGSNSLFGPRVTVELSDFRHGTWDSLKGFVGGQGDKRRALGAANGPFPIQELIRGNFLLVSQLLRSTSRSRIVPMLLAVSVIPLLSGFSGGAISSEAAGPWFVFGVGIVVAIALARTIWDGLQPVHEVLPAAPTLPSPLEAVSGWVSHPREADVIGLWEALGTKGESKKGDVLLFDIDTLWFRTLSAETLAGSAALGTFGWFEDLIDSFLGRPRSVNAERQWIARRVHGFLQNASHQIVANGGRATMVVLRDERVTEGRSPIWIYFIDSGPGMGKAALRAMGDLVVSKESEPPVQGVRAVMWSNNATYSRPESEFQFRKSERAPHGALAALYIPAEVVARAGQILSHLSSVVPSTPHGHSLPRDRRMGSAA